MNVLEEVPCDGYAMLERADIRVLRRMMSHHHIPLSGLVGMR